MSHPPARPVGPARRAVQAAVALALSLPLLAVGTTAPPAAAEADRSALQRAFSEAAAEYGVPESVLLGVAYLQSRWDGHHGAASVSGGYGPLHLTDVATALAESADGAGHHAVGAEDPRGDHARPLPRDRPAASDPHQARPAAGLAAEPGTLPLAAELTGLPPDELRAEAAANVRGGAALLAHAQRELGAPASTDPADWYGAVAAYPRADTRDAAEGFADEVYRVIAEGPSRTTAEGQRMALPPADITPDTATAEPLDLPDPARDPAVECPRRISCAWLPAPYEELPDGGYGNHDRADRPASQPIDYIVIHDTEATWETTLDLVQDPAYVSWHYSLRSADGHVAQHLATRDVGWHAGNWYVNAGSIGLEHEGFLTEPDAWYTEAMYRSSARLVRYLAARHDIPLDRHHIIGHDNVQGPTGASVSGMHTDPGPYWDWAHYFELLGAPFQPTGGPRAGLVTIAPDYAAHRPEFTDCAGAGSACVPHGSSAVRLHTAPDHEAPLVSDFGTHPGDGRSSTGVNDVGARATAGQQFVVADRRGDWTGIWYLGQLAWFHNPAEAPTALPARGLVATGRGDAPTIPVYGRAYPEAAAYPADVPAQDVVPLAYEIPADQAYVVGQRVPSSYYWAVSFDPAGHRVISGEEYYQVQLGHRIAYVRAADVTLRHR
ncbi:N-acetylmuramoyl-L-alanine amidase [Streptomyces sp. DSM 44915]|uniref:N-acetylmuramoyl-L-alanine amidase n=1 Tax=Streptomyces chisholmiae TaxID=3075540 RepID=A0ABU2JZF9_9ACTN|nr:N-acetylmuramoyl-L-alanine amidase [Streptomyces sp. DSM 44915]MDT0270129.1 N-acetylmuramoyl-L-alanine amidase [Streptomyces sp. DSM 44915]